MAQGYTKEQLEEIYQTLPEELKDAIFSVETSNTIWKTCEDNGISDNRVSQVGGFVGDILMGLTPLESLQGLLEKDLNIPEISAKKIAQEISHSIFFPLRPVMENFLKKKPVSGKPSPVTETPVGPIKEKTEQSSESDFYREPIE